MRRLLLTIAALLALAGPAAAAPLGPAAPGSPSQPAKPAGGQIKLFVFDLFLVHKQLVTVQGRGFTVTGNVQPYVAGQWVTVRAALGKHTFKRVRVLVKPAQHGRFGHFSVHVTAPSPGTVTVYADHARSTAQLGFTAHRQFLTLGRSASFGSTGRFVQLIQQRLAALHFYVRQTGVYDDITGWAVDAYHRLLHRGTSHTLDGTTVSYLLNGWGQFRVRYPHQGHHAEGDLGTQLLALIDGRKVRAIFPISSGKPSTPTVLGSFRIYRRVPGYLPDGMYYSSFFVGGYAIHGFNPAPDYPASHGCMRVQISEAIWIYNWLNYGDWVDSYY